MGRWIVVVGMALAGCGFDALDPGGRCAVEPEREAEAETCNLVVVGEACPARGPESDVAMQRAVSLCAEGRLRASAECWPSCAIEAAARRCAADCERIFRDCLDREAGGCGAEREACVDPCRFGG